MNKISVLSQALLVTPALLQTAIAVFMVLRKTYRQLPVFFTYTVFVAVSSVLVEALSYRAASDRHVYVSWFYAYWACEAVSIFLGFMVIGELFKNLFREYDALRKLTGLIFRWALLVLILVTFATAAAAPSGTIGPLVSSFLSMERSMRFIQVGLLAFLFLFATYFKVQWQDVVFGTALGYGLYVCSDMMLAAAFSHFGFSADGLYKLAKPLAYNCSVFIWAVYLIRRPQPIYRLDRVPTTELDDWNHALARMLQQ